MKRLLAILLLLAMLTGCGPKVPPETEPPVTAVPTESTAAPTQEPTQAPTTAPTEPEKSFLDGASPWQGDENLLEISLPQFSQQYYESVQILDDRLLLGRMEYEPFEEEGMDGGQEPTGYTMLSIDLVTGETVCERSVKTGTYLRLQQMGSELALCDSSTGHIEVYDRDLNLVRSWKVEPDSADWYLYRKDGKDQLLRFCYGEDLTAEDLETHVRESIHSRHQQMWPGIQRGSALPLSVLVEGTDRTQTVALDLATGEETVCPLPEPVYSPVKVGDCWLGSRMSTAGEFLLSRGGETLLLAVGGDHVLLLDDGRLTVSDGNVTRLYDPDGSLLDSCSPCMTDQGYWFWEMMYSPRYAGYFMVLDEEDGQRHLLLWQPETEPRAEDGLLLVPYEPETPAPGTLADPQYYERAAQLSEKYGMEIRIADQCDTDFGSFRADPLEQVYRLGEILDTLEDTLERYPEGFFRQLCWGSVTGVQIQITGPLHTASDAYDTEEQYAAFVTIQDKTARMVCNGYMLHGTVIAHELSHIIDRKLEWNAGNRQDALYSEEQWASFNPEGFAYRNDYRDVESSFDDESLYRSFVSPYATTYPTEDRAMVMEAAVMLPWTFDDAPGLQAKLRYYSDCIRDCFDTTGWPETTVWEQVMLEWEDNAA